MTKLKICGLTDLADARFCAAAGADYLGFIQYEKSPRYVAPQAAKEIIDWMYGPQSVGVFVNADAETINRRADEVGFDLVQLHGVEPPGVCAQIERPVIKALHVGPGDTAASLRPQCAAYVDEVDYFLLDTKRAGLWGGTGQAFDWDVARTLAADYPLFLAGGLSANNVAEAVHRTTPFAIDLSSSLEAAPGKKDFDMLVAFFAVWDALKADAT